MHAHTGSTSTDTTNTINTKETTNNTTAYNSRHTPQRTPLMCNHRPCIWPRTEYNVRYESVLLATGIWCLLLAPEGTERTARCIWQSHLRLLTTLALGHSSPSGFFLCQFMYFQ